MVALARDKARELEDFSPMAVVPHDATEVPLFATYKVKANQ